MHKIKVHFNKPDPAPATISKYKDFNRFINRYQQFYTPSGIRNLFKYDIKKLVLVVIIVVLILLMIFAEDGEAKNVTQDKIESTK